jgi:NitT/TauT family transport system substrate-binding protein
LVWGRRPSSAYENLLKEDPMDDQHTEGWSRRAFLGGLTLAGTAGLLCLHPKPVAAEPALETTRLRVIHSSPICTAPQYVAEALLQREGFTEVQYVKREGRAASYKALAAGDADLDMGFAGSRVIGVDAGDPIVMLAGVHIGCLELFGTERIRTMRDLKGKSVAVTDLGSGRHLFLASVLAYVGLNPNKDVHLITHSAPESMRLFGEGKIDAFMAWPPEPQELRANQIGHVVVSTMMDRPWSQYFCCIATGNREFVRNHPVATKRALRAILKAADVCALEPERAAQLLVDKGYVNRYDSAFQSLKEIPYGKWREYNPEDSVRFYALRLHEAGMIKSTPQKLIAQGTDWRFLNELKRERKG